MATSFFIRKFREEDVSVLCIEGYLDAHTAPTFEETIQREVESGFCRIIVDCQKLDYISSAGLGVFMSYVEEIRERNGDIRICGLTPKVKEVFDILGFPDIFDLFEDIPAARKSFPSPIPAKEQHGES
jgi:anti-sigma B factor antagonist